MLIRVRTNVGLWRVTVEENGTITDLKDAIAQSRPHVQYTSAFSHDPAGTKELSSDTPFHLLQHGSMIHVRVDPTTCATQSSATASASAADVTSSSSNVIINNTSKDQQFRRVIGKDGSIQLIPISEAPTTDKGFRKGMMALRDMKMSWTLNDFMALDAQFEFKIARQEASICQQVSLNVTSITQFQLQCQQTQFRKRYGFLYGKIIQDDDEKPKIQVDVIYTPPQQTDDTAPEGFTMPDDPREKLVDELAEIMGLQKVGWIFCHAHRDGYVLSGAEAILAAEFQLEAAGGVEETPFCTVVCQSKADGSVAVEAYQVSQQCMQMVAEEALQHSETDNLVQVNETFTAIQEGKPSPTIETDFFVTVVPISQHESHWLAEFDASNPQAALQRQLRVAHTQGWSLEDRLRDFQLLLYIATVLDDWKSIGESLRNETPLNDGYKILLTSLAGLDNAY